MSAPLICHLTSVHDPLDVRIFRKECATLSAAGYRVALVAPRAADTVVGGIPILAVPVFGRRWKRFLFSPWFVMKRGLGLRASLYHFHDPELIGVGILLKLLGKRVVYDAHEALGKDILDKEYIPLPLRRAVALMAGRAESLGALFFDAIVAATPAIAAEFPKDKVVTIQNFPRIPDGEVTSRPDYKTRPPRAVNIGLFSPARGIRQMVAAAALCRNSAMEILLAGKFSEGDFLHQCETESGWDRIRFVGWRSPEEVDELLSTCRVGLVLFQPIANHLECQPTKLFEYLLAGIPIIASDFPLWRRWVSQSGCGLLVDPADPKAIANAMDWIFDHPEEAQRMGEAGQRLVREKLNWKPEGINLTRLYASLLPTAAGSGVREWA